MNRRRKRKIRYSTRRRLRATFLRAYRVIARRRLMFMQRFGAPSRMTLKKLRSIQSNKKLPSSYRTTAMSEIARRLERRK